MSTCAITLIVALSIISLGGVVQGLTTNIPYSFTLTKNSSLAATQVQIPLIGNISSNLYSIQVNVGTPSRTFNLLPDFTSSYTFLPEINGECSGTGCGGIVNKYDP